MNEYLIYTFNAYNTPSIAIRKIEANDVLNAIQMSGIPTAEIICIKLKMPIADDGE